MGRRALVIAAVALTHCSPARPLYADDPEGLPSGGGDVGNVRAKVEPPAQAGPPGQAEPPGPSVETKVEARTAYFFRGYNLIDTGYIVQPEATLSLWPVRLDPYTLTPYVGVWNNLSEAKGPDGRIWSHWTEFDATGGMAVERGEWSLDLQWNYYLSPSDFFDSTQEVGATLAYDGGLAGVEFRPHVGLFRELDDQADGDENTYLEAGVEPEFPLTKKLGLAVPVTLGMSLDGYYRQGGGDNAFFGYAGIGLRPSYSIDEHWSVYAGVEYLRLFADSTVAANGGDEDEVIGVVGVAFNY